MYYLDVASFEFSFNISSPWEKKSILLKLSLIATRSFLLSRRRQGVYRLPTNSGATRDTWAAWALAASLILTWQGDRGQVYLVDSGTQPLSDCEAVVDTARGMWADMTPP